LTNRKNQNSILILTTLGVYLGLLIVGGAAPQVFAHSATTRAFEITDEIEVKDDLDNKPDAEESLVQFASSLEEIYRVAAEISRDNPEGVDKNQYNFNFFVTYRPKGGSNYLSKPEFNTGPRTHSGRYSTPLRNLYDTFLERSEVQHERFRVDFELTQPDIAFKANLFADSDQIAKEQGRLFAESLVRLKDREIEIRKSLIYSETRVEVHKNQVTIVTRLPRAALDPLLANNAK
jgi:hypothetical protein